MKALFTIITLTLAFNVISAEVVCEKKRGRWYPKNKLAIDMAKSMRLKTCFSGNSTRFLDTVKKAGHTHNVDFKARKLTDAEVIKKYAASKQ